MTASACPDRDTLQMFLSLRLSGDERERVAEHVETCDICLQVIETLCPDDNAERLGRALTGTRTSGARTDEPTTGETAIEDLLDRLLKLPDETVTDLQDDPESTVRVAAPPDRFESGDCIDRFELVERIGTGSFGSVWRARDPQLNRMVALKIERASVQGRQMADLLHEARAASELRHPGIVRVYEAGQHDGSVYVVSELVDGRSLQEVLAARKNDVDRSEDRECRSLAELARQIADAVGEAHRQAVVHRDLKPANVMISTDGRPIVLDFGLARRDDEQTIAAPGMMLGTPAYMSPEQARREPHKAGPPADVYSLGVMLFEMLTGERPFRGDVHVLLARIVNDPAPEARTLVQKLPLDLNTICQKCLEKDPALRYPTANELAADLQRFLNNEPIHARPVGPGGRLWRWCRRRPGLAVALSALIVVASTASVAVTAAWLSERDARQISDSRLETANDAVLDLTAIGFELRDLPGGVQSSEKLLGRVIELSQRIAQTRDDEDPAQQMRLARLLLNLAEIHRQLAEFDQAHAAVAASEQNLAMLTSDPDRGSAAAIEIAAARSQEGLILASEQKHEEALPCYADCLKRIAASGSLTGPLAERRDDVEAVARFGAAMTHFALGQLAETETHLRQAEAAWKALADSGGDESERYLIRQSSARRVLGRLCTQTGRLDAAESYASSALTLIDGLIVGRPDDPALVELRASTLLDLAAVQRQAGQLADELETTNECVASYESVLGVSTSPQACLELTLAQIARAQLLRRSARLSEAIEAAAEADDLTSALLTLNPGAPDYLLAYAQMSDIHGVLLADAGLADEALQWCLDAHRVFEQFATQATDVPLYRELLAVNLSHTGRVYGQLGESELAAASFTQAAELLEGLKTAWPARAAHYESLSVAVLQTQAFLHFEMGQPDPARELYTSAIARRRKLAQSAPHDHENSRELLKLLTLCPVTDLRDALLAATLADQYVEVEHGQETALSLTALAWLRAGRTDDCRRLLEEHRQQLPGSQAPNELLRVLLESSNPQTSTGVRQALVDAVDWQANEATARWEYRVLRAEAEQSALPPAE